MVHFKKRFHKFLNKLDNEAVKSLKGLKNIE